VAAERLDWEGKKSGFLRNKGISPRNNNRPEGQVLAKKSRGQKVSNGKALLTTTALSSEAVVEGARFFAAMRLSVRPGAGV
jgi:hypothetical protein